MKRGRRITELFGTELPIVQAPMANAQDHELAVEVSEAGGLGSIPCATSTPEKIRAEVASFRRRSAKPMNLNFFCHTTPAPDPEKSARWLHLLEAYYAELGIDPTSPTVGAARTPFDETQCAVVEDVRPAVVSFHFGLPAEALLERVRGTGAKIIASATTVAEARRLEADGCDAIIAQGAEAGGHRGMFISDDVDAQVGTFALVPQIVDAVSVPVIAAGAVTDARGIVAAFALGAAGVQLGTAYLRCPEAKISPLYRAALAASRDDATRITNVFTGRPARGFRNRLVRELGPMNEAVPSFPLAAVALAPLRAKAEERGADDFSSLWAGQAAALARDMVGAGALTRALADEAAALMRELSE